MLILLVTLLYSLIILLILIAVLVIVKELIGIELIITKSCIFNKRCQDWLRFECNYSIKDKNDNIINFENVYVSTSAEKLVEVGKQFTPDMYPFKTTINIDNKGFYEFN